MKSTHRQAARAKRQRVHMVTTYGLLDTLFAAPDAPMPIDKRTHQLTRMYGGLRALETDTAPAPDDWRVVSDAVNLMETLVKDMRLCEDPGGLLEDAVAALAIAGACWLVLAWRMASCNWLSAPMAAAHSASCGRSMLEWRLCKSIWPAASLLVLPKPPQMLNLSTGT